LFVLLLLSVNSKSIFPHALYFPRQKFDGKARYVRAWIQKCGRPDTPPEKEWQIGERRAKGETITV
jgi:hypothetical protein